MDLADPTFPPLLNGIPVDRHGDPFAEARAKAVGGEAAAGDSFWSRDAGRCRVAIVLEPEVEAGRALQMLFAAMVALGDALGAIAAPEIGIYYRWPGGIMINGARVGGVSVALPEDTGGADVPDWMVVAVTLQIHGNAEDLNPGLDPDNTSLYEEGGMDVTRTDLIESFCRHFLTWVNEWENEGFKGIHENWVGRFRALDEEVDLEHAGERHKGTFVGLDDLGNLLYRPDEGEGSGTVRSLNVLASAERGIAGA